VTQESQESRPPRKIHALTPAGQHALDDWLRAPVQHGRDFRMEFLAKVYFAQRQGAAALAVLCAEQEAACSAWEAQLHADLAALEPASYEALVYRFRLGQVQAMRDWLRQNLSVPEIGGDEQVVL
jgi:hypothetical protein